MSCRALRHDGRRDPEPGAWATAATPTTLPFFGGMSDLEGEPEDRREDARDAARCCTSRSYVHSYMHCWRHKTPIIYRATHAVVRRHGRRARPQRREARETLRETRARAASRRRASIPAWGQARLHGMIANRPDWTLSRQRQWGVPMPFFVAPRDRRAASAHARAAGAGRPQRVEQGGIEAWQPLEPRGTARRRGRAVRQDHATRSTSGSTPARRTRRCWAGRGARAAPARTRRTGSPPTSTSRAPTSTAAGSTRRCWSPACSTACRRTRRC